MRFHTLTVLNALCVVSVSALHEFKNFCRNDACQKAVQPTGSRHFSAGRKDCSSFFATTIRPAPVTVTATVTGATETVATVEVTETSVSTTTTTSTTTTSTSTTTPGPSATKFQRRQVTQAHTNIPTYASACTDIFAYSSACKCLGVQHKTKTLVAKTVTTTLVLTESDTVTTTTTTTSPTTTTAEATSTSTVSCSDDQVVLRVSSPGNDIDGRYWKIAPTGYDFEFTLQDTNTYSDATPFLLQGGYVYYYGQSNGVSYVMNYPSSYGNYALFFDTSTYADTQPQCVINNGKLECTAYQQDDFVYCAQYSPKYAFGPGVDGPCPYTFTLDVLPACGFP